MEHDEEHAQPLQLPDVALEANFVDNERRQAAERKVLEEQQAELRLQQQRQAERLKEIEVHQAEFDQMLFQMDEAGKLTCTLLNQATYSIVAFVNSWQQFTKNFQQEIPSLPWPVLPRGQGTSSYDVVQSADANLRKLYEHLRDRGIGSDLHELQLGSTSSSERITSLAIRTLSSVKEQVQTQMQGVGASDGLRPEERQVIERACVGLHSGMKVYGFISTLFDVKYIGQDTEKLAAVLSHVAGNRLSCLVINQFQATNLVRDFCRKQNVKLDYWTLEFLQGRAKNPPLAFRIPSTLCEYAYDLLQPSRQVTELVERGQMQQDEVERSLLPLLLEVFSNTIVLKTQAEAEHYRIQCKAHNIRVGRIVSLDGFDLHPSGVTSDKDNRQLKFSLKGMTVHFGALAPGYSVPLSACLEHLIQTDKLIDQLSPALEKAKAEREKLEEQRRQKQADVQQRFGVHLETSSIGAQQRRNKRNACATPHTGGNTRPRHEPAVVVAVITPSQPIHATSAIVKM